MRIYVLWFNKCVEDKSIKDDARHRRSSPKANRTIFDNFETILTLDRIYDEVFGR
jgi:hypothetical protein